MLKFITVATHSESYFDILKKSCENNNIELVVLGYDDKWQGFTWRFNLLSDYIKTLSLDEIVVVVDAFDVFVLQNKNNEIIDRFLKQNTDLLFSVDNRESIIMSKISNIIFPKCKNNTICMGMYMGRVHAINNFYKDFCLLYNCDDHKLDDQRALSFMCPSYIKLDVNNKIFCNINFDSKYTLTDNKLKTINSIYEPCIVHGPGNADIRKIANAYGYNTDNIIQITKFKSFYKRIPLYTKFFIKEIVFTFSILILIIILIIVKYKYA